MNILRDSNSALEHSMLEGFDSLLRALDPEALNENRYQAQHELPRFGRIFGGQLLGQALVAAGKTCANFAPHSLHANFVAAGSADQPLELQVDRVRDGRSTATRQVSITQSGRPLLVATVSLANNTDQPEFAEPPPAVKAPEEFALLQDWANAAPPQLRQNAQVWIDTPPPLELRIGEPPYFLGEIPARGSRSHWMRLPRTIGDNPLLHSALLAYASDYFMVDMAYRNHPQPAPLASFISTSLDHSLWLHRPVRFDEWHLHTLQLLAISGQRGLVRGAIHDTAGRLIASTAQEVLVRVST